MERLYNLCSLIHGTVWTCIGLLKGGTLRSLLDRCHCGFSAHTNVVTQTQTQHQYRYRAIHRQAPSCHEHRHGKLTWQKLWISWVSETCGCVFELQSMSHMGANVTFIIHEIEQMMNRLSVPQKDSMRKTFWFQLCNMAEARNLQNQQEIQLFRKLNRRGDWIRQHRKKIQRILHKDTHVNIRQRWRRCYWKVIQQKRAQRQSILTQYWKCVHAHQKPYIDTHHRNRMYWKRIYQKIHERLCLRREKWFQTAQKLLHRHNWLMVIRQRIQKLRCFTDTHATNRQRWQIVCGQIWVKKTQLLEKWWQVVQDCVKNHHIHQKERQRLKTRKTRYKIKACLLCKHIYFEQTLLKSTNVLLKGVFQLVKTNKTVQKYLHLLNDFATMNVIVFFQDADEVERKFIDFRSLHLNLHRYSQKVGGIDSSWKTVLSLNDESCTRMLAIFPKIHTSQIPMDVFVNACNQDLGEAITTEDLKKWLVNDTPKYPYVLELSNQEKIVNQWVGRKGQGNILAAMSAAATTSVCAYVKQSWSKQ